MSRAKQRADRIRQDIDIVQVLADYGYRVNPGGGDREQQFSCDLHGDGSDSKPSARVYPSSNSWYCFACGRPRDAIQTCREKEGQDFWAAVKTLETRYHLPQLPWEDEVEQPHQDTISEKVQEALKSDFSYAEVKNRVERYLQIATDEREMRMMTVLSLWEAFDIVTLDVENGVMTEDRGRVALVSLLHKAQELFAKDSA